ncbi:MAG: LacI family DNA-binding transcriptional regulator [Pseudomonadota bacterium]
MVKRKGTVTISQVAQAAGVNRSSVSRAFTKPYMLTPETVARIKAVADTLGYVPNRTARALSTGRNSNLALIVPDVANPFFPPMIRAAQDAADAQDYCVFLGNSNEDPSKEDRLVGRFIGQVEGLILASSRLPEKRILDYAEQRPIVLINRDVAGVPRVLIDSSNGMTEAVRFLAERGHKKIAYVSGPSGSWSNKSRRSAVRKAAQQAGLELYVCPAQVSSFEAGLSAVDRILDAGTTVAIAFDDVTAHGILAGLEQRGITVPDGFSVVGCDDVLGDLTHPPLTTISSRSSEAGDLAVSLMYDALRSVGLKDARYLLQTELVVRQTTK